jgi:hypothetical protein
VMCALADEVMMAAAAKAIMDCVFDFMAWIFLGKRSELDPHISEVSPLRERVE